MCGCRSQKGGAFSANTMTQLFLNIYRAAGFENASSHSGRRTFITELASKGVSVRVLAIVLLVVVLVVMAVANMIASLSANVDEHAVGVLIVFVMLIVIVLLSVIVIVAVIVVLIVPVIAGGE